MWTCPCSTTPHTPCRRVWGRGGGTGASQEGQGGRERRWSGDGDLEPGLTLGEGGQGRLTGRPRGRRRQRRGVGRQQGRHLGKGWPRGVKGGQGGRVPCREGGEAGPLWTRGGMTASRTCSSRPLLSPQACLVSCFQQLMVETCSCGYFFYPLPSGAEYCSSARHPAWGESPPPGHWWGGRSGLANLQTSPPPPGRS